MFKLKIETGNEAMRSAADVADALRTIADRMESPGYESGNVRDRNGNTVGRYELTAPELAGPSDGDRYTTEELEELPVLHQGQADDCHVDTGTMRVWLSRTGLADGEPFENTVTVEQLVDGAWVEVEKYNGDNTSETASE